MIGLSLARVLKPWEERVIRQGSARPRAVMLVFEICKVSARAFLSVIEAYVAEPCSPAIIVFVDVARRVAQVRQAARREYRKSEESSRPWPPMIFCGRRYKATEAEVCLYKGRSAPMHLPPD